MCEVTQQMSGGDKEIIRLSKWSGIKGRCWWGLQEKLDDKEPAIKGTECFQAMEMTVAEALRREEIGTFFDLIKGQR